MNFYNNRSINPNAGRRTIKDMRSQQPMPPTTGAPAVTITVNQPLTFHLPDNAKIVVAEFDEATNGLGSYIVDNAKKEHASILKGVSSSDEGLKNLLSSLTAEYEAMRNEEKEEEGKEGDKEGEQESEEGSETQEGNDEVGGHGAQPTYSIGVAEKLLRGWVGSVTRMLSEAQEITAFNLSAIGAEESLLKDDIYATRDILKSMINAARVINRREGKVFSVERRPVGKIRLDRNIITCYLLTVSTVLPNTGKHAVKYSEDHSDGITYQCALMRNGYRWLALPLDKVAGVVDELDPISYSHRVGRQTTRIIFGSLFGHGLISQVYQTASQSQLKYNELNKIRF